ncbi:MAG: hypothetical protein LBB89_08065 [Treponema sp.]|jgi:hypothetical protein|nr:hypothetical protein [Treponema sp.]
MKYAIIFSFAFFFMGISVYGDSVDDTPEDTGGNDNKNQSKIYVLPSLSYNYISFDKYKLHDISGMLTLFHFNPAEKGKVSSVTLAYSPQIAAKIDYDFPNLFHNASLSVMHKIDRHIITGAFSAMTEKPLYGGSRTFMGMAGYLYNLVNGEHFSMNLGVTLLVMDIGITMNNGTPWLIWPLPMFNLSWDYEWISFGVIPGVKMTIGPKFPVSIVAKTVTGGYDAALWYRYFKDKDPANELLGMAVGFKKETSDVMISDGGKYGINYNSLYGSLRLFKFLELSGGWTFDGKEEYEKITKDSILGFAGFSKESKYISNVGGGYFFSISFKMNM